MFLMRKAAMGRCVHSGFGYSPCGVQLDWERWLTGLFFCCALWLGTAESGVHAAAVSSDPHALVARVSQELIAALQAYPTGHASAGASQGKERSPQAVYRILERLLLPHADFEEMARRVLTSHWPSLSSSDKREFVSALQILVLKTYAALFTNYNGQVVRFLPAREVDYQENRVQVRSVVDNARQGGPSVAVDYRLIQKNGVWKVYDIGIDGISVVSSYRGQFVPAVSQKGFARVLSELQERNRQGFSHDE